MRAASGKTYEPHLQAGETYAGGNQDQRIISQGLRIGLQFRNCATQNVRFIRKLVRAEKRLIGAQQEHDVFGLRFALQVRFVELTAAATGQPQRDQGVKHGHRQACGLSKPAQVAALIQLVPIGVNNQ